jgi:chromosome segregation ATPase
MAKKSTDEIAERYAQMKEERDTFEAKCKALEEENNRLKSAKQPVPSIAPTPTHAEQRESALVTAFRNLNPDIIWLKNSLDTLLKQMAAFVNTILDLTKLLSESFPIKITEEDKQKLTQAVHDACADKLAEINRISEENNSDRVSMSSLDFWSIIYLLITLVMAFALTIAANAMILHSEPLTKMLWYISTLIALPAIAVIIFRIKKNDNS